MLYTDNITEFLTGCEDALDGPSASTPIRMTFQAPPTLLQLAGQSLVTNEALAISTLQNLPIVLFPPLLKEADTQRRKKIMKVLVKDWPYPCLPVGLLMSNPNVEIYQAMLDGVDTWLRRTFRPRGQKLRVVDLRSVHHDFWDVWTGRKRVEPSAKTSPERQRAKRLSRYTLRRHLKVVAELQLPQDEQQARLLQWAQKRRDSLQLCCVKLKIGTLPFYRVREVLKFLQLEFIEELELNTACNLSTLVHFVPYISKMSHLHKVMIVRIFKGRTATVMDEERVTEIMSVFSKLSYLQHLSLDDVYFVNNHMKLLLSVNFYDNDFSINVLKELLHHTANLSQLTKELYPAPKEVYNHLGYINVEQFSQCCAELKNTLIPERQFRSIRFGSNVCYDCGKRYIYELETTLCDC
ncbi:hypothetical protein U0070_016091 [Myodes glareolus]|uniref:Uncharacterized protein n=1 Tax=Myodes glareolus TaxID=447135 RepID=A0AAW0I9S0_MYOGA